MNKVHIMERKNLEGFYSENELQEMLHNGDINHLQYVCHHSEGRKIAFVSFCGERGLSADDKAAQQFVEYQLNQEEKAHSEYLD